MTNGYGIPAYAGTTIMEGEMDASAGDAPKRRGALRPVSLIPRGLVIPAKAGTYWRTVRLRESRTYPHRRAPTPVPSPAAFAASSPLIGRGGSGALRRWGRDSRLRGNDGKE